MTVHTASPGASGTERRNNQVVRPAATNPAKGAMQGRPHAGFVRNNLALDAGYFFLPWICHSVKGDRDPLMIALIR
jgi:hypothetical protein